MVTGLNLDAYPCQAYVQAMSSRHPLLWLLPLILLACKQPSPAPAAGQPAPSAAATEVKPAATSKFTGVLSEEAFKQLHEQRDSDAPAAKGEMIKLSSSNAYLSLPDKGQAPFPAVVVIHEWWGLNQHIKHWSDRLAEDGYAALAVDLYGGNVADESKEALKLMKAVDEKVATAVLLEAAQFLKTDPRIKASRRASIGWCFGGRWSLELALAEPSMDAAVIYYGHVSTDAKKLSALQTPLLGIFGNQDTGIPPATVDAFDAALTEVGKQHKILRYDANHAFANPSSARYQQQAAEQAWGEVRSFLKKQLQP